MACRCDCAGWDVIVSVFPGAAVGGLLEREAELARADRVFHRVGAGAGGWLPWRVRLGLVRASC